MSRTNSTRNFGGFGGIVNGIGVLIGISIIGAGYISAIGSFAGVA